jgi:hypothetical protein
MAISSPIKPSTFLVPTRLRELKAINGLSKKLYQEKRNRFLLEKKLYKLEQKSLEKRQLQERESAQESDKKLSLKSSAKRVVYNAAVGVGSFLFDLLQFFIGYKIVEWIGKPENSKKVLGIVKGLKGIFDFLSWFVTGTIDNAFSGLHSVIFGENLLERFLGFFRLIVGFLGFRYLLRPGKLFKDLGFVIKNSGKILDVFNSFRKSGIKEGSEKLLQTLPKTAAIFKRGLSRGITRGVLKVFGKGGIRLLSKVFGFAFKAVKKIILGPIKAVAKKTVAGIPVVGPLLDLGINLVLGDPLDKALVKAAGSTLGMGLGALVGSALPGPGTIVGGALGGLVGDWAADKLYGWIKGLFGKKDENLPQLAVGGIVTQPTKAIIGEAGPEAVIPLPQLLSGDIFSSPLSILASSIIGGVNAVLFSMGSVGNLIRPFAQQLFAPFTREFGIKRFTFASGLGKTAVDIATMSTNSRADELDDKKLNEIIGKNKKVNLLASKSTSKKSRYNGGNSIREILADIFNNIINLDFGSKSKATPGGNDKEADQSLTAAELDAIKASSADKRAAAHLATLEASAPQHVADVYQVILNRAAKQSGGIPSVITAKEQFTPYSAALYGGSPGDSAASSKYGSLGLTKKELFDLASKPDGIQQLTNRFQAGNPKVAAQVLADFESNGPLSQSAKKFVGGAQYFLGYGAKGGRRRPDGGNWFRDRYQVGGVVATPGVPDTGPGYTIKGAKDQSGRPIVFSQPAAAAFAKMMRDSAGVVKPSDVASSKRSPEKNSSLPGSARKSKHLYGLAMDIHGSSNQWIRKHGSKYGWLANDYSGSHGGHFEFRGEGITPSEMASQTQQSGSDNKETEPSWGEILTQLSDLYKGLTGTPKTDGATLQRNSMDMIQTQQIISTAFKQDTYIIAPPTTIANTVNVVGPLPQNNIAMNTSFAYLDNSSSYLQRRL